MRRTVLIAAFAALLNGVAASAALAESFFDDPMFRRCYQWMVDGQRGSMIDNLCLDVYGIPSPSLFICARKINEGFSSEADMQSCAFVFEEYAKKAKGGYVLR